MKKAMRWLLVMALFGATLPLGALPVAAVEGHPLVAPTLITESNFKLTDGGMCPAEYKFDSIGGEHVPWIPEVDGDPVEYTWEVPFCDGSGETGEVTVKLWIYSSADGQLVKFEITGGKAGYVYVKGGPGGNLYDYTGLSGVTADEGLHAPVGPSGSYAAVSHVSFCLCAVGVEKDWEFTAPDAFADRGYTYTAYYKKAADAGWTAVPLADADEDGVWTAKTTHQDGDEIWWKWIVKDGDDVVFDSGTLGPETLLLAESPYLNDFKLCLKQWVWDPPAFLEEVFDSLEATAYYSLDGVDYVEVPLVMDAEGVFKAETLFKCGTEIYYYFKIVGKDAADAVKYTYQSEPPVDPEPITGPATVVNAFQAPQTLKLWQLTATVEPAGGTYYAAWSINPAGPWTVVELEQDAMYPELYKGDSNLYEGMSIYWKFYDAEWSTTVFGPETLVGAEKLNEYERYGVTRTIGYWGTHPCMAAAMLERLGGSVVLGWTTIGDINELMAIMNYPQMDGAPKLKPAVKAKLQTSRQLAGAILNAGFGTSVPTVDWKGTEMSIIEAAKLALVSGNTADIIFIGGLLDEFNNSGDDEWLPDWKPECWNDANPQGAIQAGIIGWPGIL